MTVTSPLILTLRLNDAAFQFFDRLRCLYFPPERNFLKAHLTLFHHLPGAEEKAICNTIQALCAEQAPIKMNVSAVTGIGRGVAFRIESKELLRLHAALQQEWDAWLIPQDRQRLWPHVTVQNKVPPEVAKALLEQLAQTFQPFEAMGTGLVLWQYKGGPWELEQEFPFSGVSP